MIEAKVIVPYIDKYTGVFNQPGTVIEVPEKRAEELSGYIEKLTKAEAKKDEPKAEKKADKAPAKAKPKATSKSKK